MAAHGSNKNANKISGKKKGKPRRQPSLLRKPVIEVRGKLGKAQKSKKKKIKKVGSSTIDFYEAKVEGTKPVRPDSTIINAAPKDLQQEIPKKLRELMKSREQLTLESQLSKRKRRAIKVEKEKKKEEAVDTWFKRPIKAVPKFEKKHNESDRTFYARVERESNEFMKIAKFEDENECKVVKNEKGEIQIEKRIRRKQIKTKEFREKKKLQKQSKLKKHKDFTDLQDHVAFNERTDRPPEELALPRKASEKEKSAKLNSLNLMGLLNNSSKKKMTSLKSWAYKEKIDEERQRAIDMYRSIKAKKRSGPLT